MEKIGSRIVFKYEGKKREGIPCFYVHKIGGFVLLFANGFMVDAKKIDFVSSLGLVDHFFVPKQFVEKAKAFRIDSLQALPDNQNQLLVIKPEMNGDTFFEASFVSAFFDSRQGAFLDRDCNPIDIERNVVVSTGEEIPFTLSDKGMKAMEKIYPTNI